MNLSFLYPALCFLPCAFMAVFLKQHDRAEAKKALEPPIGTDEKFLRSPGESALDKKKDFDHKILGNLILILTSAPCLLASYLSIPPNQRFSLGISIVWVIAIAIYGCLMIYWFRQLSFLYEKRHNWLLGYRGERAVGEYLNQLMLHGCHVFHDFPLNGKANLDHIVVASSGVYAIETKTKSKHSQLEENHKVFYDGKKLEFPSWTDTEYLAQAGDQADQLSRILTNSLKTPIEVRPILTIPGWFVELTTKPPYKVQVLNHKQIHKVIVENKRILSPDEVKTISDHLEKECRDVAF